MCNGFSSNIYIYIYIWFIIYLVLNSLVFVCNNLLTTKIKNLDGRKIRFIDRLCKAHDYSMLIYFIIGWNDWLANVFHINTPHMVVYIKLAVFFFTLFCILCHILASISMSVWQLNPSFESIEQDSFICVGTGFTEYVY